MIYLDVEKAFDRAAQKEIRRNPEKRKVNRKPIKTMKSYYHNNRNYVKYDKLQSDTFEINDLKQEGVFFQYYLYFEG